MSDIHKKLAVILADTYALYLKTQNYHWHVKGVRFASLHTLFETQYRALAEAVDLIAERLLALGHHAPATFKAFEQLATIKDGNSHATANEMVSELALDHNRLVNDLNQTLVLAQEAHDEGTVNILGERLAAHEKAHWMLNASRGE